MAILVVDDSVDSRLLIQRFLEAEGHKQFLMAGTAVEALAHLDAEGGTAIELVLMDLQLPGMNGIEACRKISEDPKLRDIPVIVITASSEGGTLPAAFQAGAVDYLLKPVNPVELAARVRSALRLKRETDQRKERQAELLEVTYKLAHANRELKRLSTLDGLTGLTNRRRFDEVLAQEWKRAAREGSPLSIILVDIDHFKAYNDRYGHLAGDDCLKRVAGALRDSSHRTGDCVARYGGEEFVAVLPSTDSAGARSVAETMRRAVETLGIEHADAAAKLATISLGVATRIPVESAAPQILLSSADEALYEAKNGGRNRIVVRQAEGSPGDPARNRA